MITHGRHMATLYWQQQEKGRASSDGKGKGRMKYNTIKGKQYS